MATRIEIYKGVNSQRYGPAPPLLKYLTADTAAIELAFPVFAHSLFAGFVVFVNEQITRDFNLPSSIIPSLSIVVGLMLVFRNQTAFSRFWNGRLHLNIITTAIRCISRQILVLVPAPDITPVASGSSTPSTSCPEIWTYNNPILERQGTVLPKSDYARTMEVVKILVAMLYTTKNHLRADWGVALSPGTRLTENGQVTTTDEYKDLLPPRMKGYEQKGLGLTLQLATFVESFVGHGVTKGWFHNAAASSMLGELNNLTKAYGDMEVIRLVPIPVAHLIHHKQTLALYCGILPFAMAAEMSWWAVPLVAFVSFTLYGIEAIAATFEDPFGRAKIDINLDAAVADARQEVEALITAWQTQGLGAGGLFRPQFVDASTSETDGFEGSSCDGDGRGAPPPAAVQVKFVVDGMGRSDGRMETTGVRVVPRSQDVSPQDLDNPSREDLFTLFPDRLAQESRERETSTTNLVDVSDNQEQAKSTSKETPQGKRVAWGSVVGRDDGGVIEADFLK
ncbi:hypothetical protein BP6252_00716 [Coleophoma cylindrospora]|uniref:Uncharacterized protein n=1 Tax=Coleophoma cylindrospora TaxID=1849047 RepID=A0A3D8SR38_9HELO|nr:hypothetical protein BP6252_00716 [Coleophoma cylindrospora]